MAVDFDENAEVSVYTKLRCPQCDSTKKLLRKLDIPFNEISIEENPEVLDFLKAEGFMSAPVVTAGDESWAGFNEKKIRDLVSINTTDSDWDF